MRVLDWRSLESMDDPGDFYILERYCREAINRTNREGMAIEIGSYRGKSTAVIAQFFNPVVAIDTWGDIYQGYQYPEQIGSQLMAFLDSMRRVGLVQSESIFPIVSSSKILEVFAPISADFIFIDGEHSYRAASQDLKRSAYHLSQRGVILVHDYKRPGYGYPPLPGFPLMMKDDPWAGVAEAVDEFLEKEPFVLSKMDLGFVSLIRREV